ncbi:hypothetical protein GCM10009839_62270 [Catenulispora yoronensis]|uniref:Uncharacterized protein n=1 Tax=Catenulispora yoronensis TaxID=450799 RepID=A0ABN2V1D6_9ACTN
MRSRKKYNRYRIAADSARMIKNRVNHAHPKSGFRLGLTQNDRTNPRHSTTGRSPATNGSSCEATTNGNANNTTGPANATYPALPGTTLLTSTTDKMTPTVVGIPIHPETNPRCSTGTRSGTPAANPACIALSEACTKHHATMIPPTVCCALNNTNAPALATAPTNVHGCRRPNRPTVTSDKAPATGCVTVATKAPTPDTHAKATTLCPAPTAAST